MNEAFVPCRAITTGPAFHWFGYYDKQQFDPTGRFVLGMEVDFEHRSPRADDRIRLGLVDLQDHDRWSEIGTSLAWSWQQGCMLQWRPGHDGEVMWNDRHADRFVSHLLNVHTGERRTLDHPFYAISPDGRWAVAPDFRRINDTRPGYGYAGLPDPFADEPAPAGSGIWRMDLQTGQREQIVSLAEVVAIPNPNDDFVGCKHWFNHLLYSPDGQRFIFLHRWNNPDRHGPRGHGTRMLTANADGTGLHVVDDGDGMSHFIWRDPQHITAWARHPSAGNAFYVFREAGTNDATVIGQGVMVHNGHNTYLPGNAWILNDTYPVGPERGQQLYLFHVPTGQRVELGVFHSPEPYKGEWRCDLHPRSSRDGRQVCIDSVHAGQGRQMYLLDITAIVDGTVG